MSWPGFPDVPLTHTHADLAEEPCAEVVLEAGHVVQAEAVAVSA
jgi:hypothetical protein